MKDTLTPSLPPFTNLSLFITFEGPEGSGKTTQIGLLATALAARGHSVVTTREPGGTRIGDAVRSVLLNAHHTEMSERAEALLFNAARAQLVDEVIRPALARGRDRAVRPLRRQHAGLPGLWARPAAGAAAPA